MSCLSSRSRFVAGLSACIAALLTASATPAQVLDPVLDGEALVRLVPAADIGAFNARYQTTTLEAVPSRQIYRLALPPESDPQQFKQAAGADADVLWVELNYAGQVAEARGRCLYFLPTPEAAGFLAQPARAQIGLPAAHQTTTGEGTVVAVVDSGIDATHVALAGLVLNTGWNFVDHNANTADVGNGLDDDGDSEIDEMTGHGTHVAGLVSMVAPTALLLPVRVVDSDGNSDNFRVAAGIFYAIDLGVDVINVSIGSTYNSEAVVDAVGEATAAGIPIVAAAGNVNVHTPGEYPALNDGVLGVAGVDANDIKSTFSNYHETLAISAPGSAIISLLPGDLFATWDGTSMAAPMVAGVAALALSRHPEWPRDASRTNSVRMAILQSAANIDALNPGFAGLLGAGRLNAVGALDASAAFASAVSYAAGPTPEAIILVDLNADGLGDMAVANSSVGTVSILLNQGAGVFGAPQTVTVGAAPLALAAADFDGDGDQDLAIVCEAIHVVWILGNHGDGTFAPPTQVPVGSAPRAVAVGQLVGIAAVDLVVACDDANALTVLRNEGNGSFVTHATIAVGQRPYDVMIGDMDGDGLQDLIAVNRNSDSISVVRNYGDGTFAAAVSFPTGAEPRAMTSGDFDGDGDLDVATANHNSRDISVLWNNGAGGYGPPISIQLANQRRPIQLASADLDCDGDTDLLATNSAETTNFVTVLLSRGDGTFVPPVDYPVAADPRGVVAGDVDGDQDPDFAIAARAAGSISILLNRGCAALHRGDMNCDGVVNFDDIDAFVVALSDPVSYYAQFPNCNRQNADCNGDGQVDFGDVNPLVELLGG